jgi:S-adenosylmethionine:tRNA ribosyltransferase-isomerase
MPDKTCKIDDLPVLKLDYNLPENLIAQKPIEKRDESRMMLCDRKTGTIEHHIFRELTDILPESTLIVRNITRVFPARVEGVKETGGKIEILFLREIDPGLWRVIFSRRARMPEGRKIFLFNSEITGTLVERIEDGEDVLKIDNPGLFNSLIKVHGKTPLPPYIKNHDIDPNRYQTVYAENIGSSAAPTAGLHFTDDLIKKLKSKGISFADVELRIGLDTFSPIRVKNLKNHIIHTEFGIIPSKTAQIINDCRSRENKILSVGTTSTRLLEFVANKYGCIKEFAGDVDLFILPGYEFKVTDHLLTNFHLPRTTLLALVGAFMGLDFMFEAYGKAIEEKYRFYSFGDSMLIL